MTTRCSTPSAAGWSRRAWLARVGSSATLLAFAPSPLQALRREALIRRRPPHPHAWPDTPSSMPLPAGPMQALAVRAVDAATSAGAQYADARLTRVVQHGYMCIDENFTADVELVAVGVRVLVNGYWGFASSPFWTSDEVAQLAQNAVAQARTNAKGPPRTVELGRIPAVTGTWVTPIGIDPFAITIEEKLDTIAYWKSLAAQHGVPFESNGLGSTLQFVRQERVLATSGGSLVTQTCYETSGHITCQAASQSNPPPVDVHGIGVAAKGWELFLDAKLPEQFVQMGDEARRAPARLVGRPVTVGRYTLVCDGATMASLVEQTVGIATQLDRALGYEADADGTSFVTDPLAMVGSLQVASPLVTITANRSAPAQLATVKWDDEGVVPTDGPLVKDGVLVDFQTTREQAAWLAPYYAKHGRPVRSNGCAASETALTITMQHMPNLAMAPGTSALALQDLIGDVQNGIFIERGRAECDWQGGGGSLSGDMRRIVNGRLGEGLTNGAVSFDTRDLWKKVVAVGGPETQGGIDTTQYTLVSQAEKGQPPQATSHSVRAVAATITNQALIDTTRQG